MGKRGTWILYRSKQMSATSHKNKEIYTITPNTSGAVSGGGFSIEIVIPTRLCAEQSRWDTRQARWPLWTHPSRRSSGFQSGLRTKALLSVESGVFTYALLNGLKNHGADANQDQTVTVSELYVIDQVRKLTRHPESDGPP